MTVTSFKLFELFFSAVLGKGCVLFLLLGLSLLCVLWWFRRFARSLSWVCPCQGKCLIFDDSWLHEVLLLIAASAACVGWELVIAHNPLIVVRMGGACHTNWSCIRFFSSEAGHASAKCRDTFCGVHTRGIIKTRDLEGVFVKIGDFLSLKGPDWSSQKEWGAPEKIIRPQKVARKLDFSEPRLYNAPNLHTVDTSQSLACQYVHARKFPTTGKLQQNPTKPTIWHEMDIG